MTAPNRPSANSSLPVRQSASWKKHLSAWGSFTAASGAALAMSTNASASIISATVNQSIYASPTASNNYVGANIHIKGTGQPFFAEGMRGGISTRTMASTTFGSFHTGPLHARGAGSVSIQGGPGFGMKFGGSAGFMRKYAAGQSVGVGALVARDHLMAGTNGVFNGPFKNGGSGFIGFQTYGGDRGWLKVDITTGIDAYPAQFELIAYAYNNVAGGAITAGQTVGASTPEPGTAPLSLLALGAAGIFALRKARKELAAK